MKYLKSFNESVSSIFLKERELLTNKFSEEIKSCREKIKSDIDDCIVELSDLSDSVDIYDDYEEGVSSIKHSALGFYYTISIGENQSHEEVLEALWESIEKLRSMMEANIDIYVTREDKEWGKSTLIVLKGKDVSYESLKNSFSDKKITSDSFEPGMKIHMEIN